MAFATRRSAHHALSDEISQAILTGIDCRQTCDGASSIGHDHFFASANTVDVPAEPVLELADPDFGSLGGYIHDASVATWGS